MRPSISALLKACQNLDPPTRRQKAISPKLLRAMYTLSGTGGQITSDLPAAIVTELAIMAYFYAMRSCEFTTTPTPGRTKIIQLNGVTFRDRGNQILRHDSPLLHRAHRVTITFANQKNGMKQDRRTHQSTGDQIMCPVVRLASLVRRILRTVPNCGGSTPINSYQTLSGTKQITSEFLRQALRTSCTLGGGEPAFGFTAADIGTRSIRSGAAMALFLMNHSVAKIMILGRWSSDAFLVYLRPQVMEWTNKSSDMLRNESFFDATDAHKALTSDPKMRQSQRFNAGAIISQHKINPHS